MLDLFGRRAYNDRVNDDVKIIVLRTDRGEGKPGADTDLYGRTLEQWVVSAMRGMETETVDYKDGDDFLCVVRDKLSTVRPITVVLYSDTPLVTYGAVSGAVAKFRKLNIDVMKLPRGWIMRTEYAFGAGEIKADKKTIAGDEDFLTVFNYNQLAYVADILRSRITYYFMGEGVEIYDPASVFIGVNVVIEPGVKIAPFCTIKGNTVIRSGAEIGEHCVIESSVIESGARVRASTLKGAYVGKNVEVGPYAHLRTGAYVCAGARIGDYVEIKNSRIGAGSKVCHLAYVGDADIGARCNIGAGAVFANYDGASKRRTTLGDNVFVGSNSTLVAPLEIGSGAFIAAGSVITENVNAGALAICRAAAVVKENWQKNKYVSENNRTAPDGANNGDPV